MNQAKQKMLDRVRAILAKTTARGCTEGEAMAALEKAQELMSAYDISEAELGVTTHQEGATIHTTTDTDPYMVRRRVAVGVSRFTRTEVWRNHGDAVVFCGLDSEVVFASWLLDTLQAFILQELRAYQKLRREMGQKCPRIVGTSFVHGCANRITERLSELAPKAPATGNALVVARRALITEAMANAGIRTKAGQRRRINADMTAWGAGHKAGDSARFDRPVGAGGNPMIGR